MQQSDGIGMFGQSGLGFGSLPAVLTDRLEGTVHRMVGTVVAATTELHATVAGLREVDGAADETSHGLEGILAATADLDRSVDDVVRLMRNTARLASTTGARGQLPETGSRRMADAIDRVDELPALIDELAGQVNLLALDVTADVTWIRAPRSDFATLGLLIRALCVRAVKATEAAARQVAEIRTRIEAVAAAVATVPAQVPAEDGVRASQAA